MTKNILLAKVVSQPKGNPEKQERSSENFSTMDTPRRTKAFLFKVTDTKNADKIRFEVKREVSIAIHPTYYKDVHNDKEEAKIETSKSFYIANPVNAEEPFTVEVYAVK